MSIISRAGKGARMFILDFDRNQQSPIFAPRGFEAMSETAVKGFLSFMKHYEKNLSFG